MGSLLEVFAEFGQQWGARWMRVNLSNHVWIPQAQYAVYSKTSTEFYVCHEDHVQTQLGWTRNKS